MLNLMSKEENEKHVHGQHHNKHHGNSRMKEPVPMEIGAAVHEQKVRRGQRLPSVGSVILFSKLQ